jgi:mannose-1-phosphate guanylyltransferase
VVTMTHPAAQSRTLWSIVLAGGEGERVRPLIQRWLGRHKPKQYCTFVGTRSMLRHTLDRAVQLTSPHRIVTVAAHGHRSEALSHLPEQHAGPLLLQPQNRDTAAGIFLPLTYIKTRDPRATVVVYPSDHFVYPEQRFLEAVEQAVRTAERLEDRLILLGVPPDRLELDYGWIQPGRYLALSGQRPVRRVRQFMEKPTAAEADEALLRGALWNTLVFSARVTALWTLGRLCFPDILESFEELSRAIGTAEEERVLERIYRHMPVKNFSADLLQRMPEACAVIDLDNVLWSDWGKPERITETLHRIGRQPAFPLECLDKPFKPTPLAS